MKTTVADEPCYNAAGELNSSCSGQKLRQYIEECFKQLEQTMLEQYTEIMKTLTKQTLMLEQLTEPETLSSYFPITSEESLQNMDALIKEGSRSKCVSAVKLLLKGGLIKKFESVLSRDVCLNFNLDGCHGKKRFKDYELYGVLREVVNEMCGDGESELRRAFQAVKKRYFKQKSLQLNSAHRKDELDSLAKADAIHDNEDSESMSNSNN